ncbi:MAG: helix-turn-helix domain-containing protein [Coprococcus sp.]
MSNQRLTTGEKIKKTRIQKEFTQKQLAEKCGMYESQIRKYESGKINPKIETLQKIANALQVPVNSLRSDSELELNSFMEYLDKSFDTFKDNLRLENKLISDYRVLNAQGRQKAHEQIEMLTKIPEYRADQNAAADTPKPSDQDE